MKNKPNGRAKFLPEHHENYEHAKENGAVYYEGPPCVTCGETERYVSHGRSCVACNKRNNKAAYDRDPLTKAVRAAKWRAERDGLAFELVREDLDVPELCPVLGTEMRKPSLDRVDNSKGYTKANTRVISWEANQLKSDLTLSQAEKIVAYMKEHYND